LQLAANDETEAKAKQRPQEYNTKKKSFKRTSLGIIQSGLIPHYIWTLCHTLYRARVSVALKLATLSHISA